MTGGGEIRQTPRDPVRALLQQVRTTIKGTPYDQVIALKHNVDAAFAERMTQEHEGEEKPDPAKVLLRSLFIEKGRDGKQKPSFTRAFNYLCRDCFERPLEPAPYGMNIDQIAERATVADILRFKFIKVYRGREECTVYIENKSSGQRKNAIFGERTVNIVQEQFEKVGFTLDVVEQ